MINSDLEKKLTIIKMSWEGKNNENSTPRIERSMDVDIENNQVVFCVSYTQEKIHSYKSFNYKCVAELEKVNETIEIIENRIKSLLASE